MMSVARQMTLNRLTRITKKEGTLKGGKKHIEKEKE